MFRERSRLSSLIFEIRTGILHEISGPEKHLWVGNGSINYE